VLEALDVDLGPRGRGAFDDVAVVPVVHVGIERRERVLELAERSLAQDAAIMALGLSHGRYVEDVDTPVEPMDAGIGMLVLERAERFEVVTGFGYWKRRKNRTKWLAGRFSPSLGPVRRRLTRRIGSMILARGLAALVRT
jgi:hypothetical protein